MIKPKKILEKIKPYVPGEQPQEKGFIKLNTNENSYPPPLKVVKAIKYALNGRLNIYPDPQCTQLRKTVAKFYKLKPEQIIIGNGSDELLKMIILSFVDNNESVGFLYPSYVLYKTLAETYGSKINEYRLETDYSLPEEVFQVKDKVFFIANPNPPLGTFYPLNEIERIIKGASGLVVLDEAYVDFSVSNGLNLINKYDNLIVTRSFSKSFSLAGMRIGIGFGNEKLISILNKVKDSYNVNVLSQVAANAVYVNYNRVKQTTDRVISNREYLRDKLIKMGIKVPESGANFIFAKVKNPKCVYEQLKKRKILVRYFNAPMMNDGLRMTIGTRKQVNVLLKEFKNIIFDNP